MSTPISNLNKLVKSSFKWVINAQCVARSFTTPPVLVLISKSSRNGLRFCDPSKVDKLIFKIKLIIEDEINKIENRIIKYLFSISLFK